MEQPNDAGQIVDFSYIMELSGGSPEYIKQVLTIFMDNTAPGIKELEKLVLKTDDWEKISKQAHFLKSGVSIVKIVGMREKLQEMETLAKERRDRPKINLLLDEVVTIFGKAESIIRSKMNEG